MEKQQVNIFFLLGTVVLSDDDNDNNDNNEMNEGNSILLFICSSRGHSKYYSSYHAENVAKVIMLE